MKLSVWLQNTYHTALKRMHGYLLSLRDVRNMGQLVFLTMIVLISWSGVKAIQANYELQKQVSDIAQQNEVQKLENSNLELQNEYYKSSQYLEVTARQNFGLAKPGETVLLVPKDVALANTVDVGDTSKDDTAAAKRAFWQENFQAWVDYFLHRNRL
ncbi:MAG: septum formation initiator family protein [Candidatus Saccharimonadales bacterium]